MSMNFHISSVIRASIYQVIRYINLLPFARICYYFQYYLNGGACV